MSDETRAILNLAAHNLVASRRDLAAGDGRVSVSRAYYAVFHAANAALNSVGVQAKSHAGVQALFGERFIREGLLDREMARTLNRLMQLRHDADYEVGKMVTMEQAEDGAARAAAFVETIEALLGGPTV